MSEKNEIQQIKAPRRRTLKGTVVSDKMVKTIRVRVDHKKAHPLYGKIMVRSKNYMVHDYKNEAGMGDFVLIEETRPLSKNKRWRLVEIIEKAK